MRSSLQLPRFYSPMFLTLTAASAVCQIRHNMEIVPWPLNTVFTCGMGEHELEPGQQKTVEVEDEDCLYLDQVIQEGCKCGSGACTHQA